MRTQFFIVLLLTPCISYFDDYNEIYDRYNQLRKAKPKSLSSKKPKRKVFRTEAPKTVNMNMTYFPIIRNDQNQAIKINDDAYPEIASVVDSPSNMYLCTAACIEGRIFVTAARCIADGAVLHTHVVYQNTKLAPIAFVLPLNKTKQMFDDIGFIVVGDHKIQWKILRVTNQWKEREDERFMWFGKVKMFKGTAIGHVAQGKRKPLYKMNVFVSNYLCYYLYNPGPSSIGSYSVPCYHTCSLEEDFTERKTTHSKTTNCKKHLAGEGHIVLDEKMEIVGLATWGPGSSRIHFNMENKRRDFHAMPIGMTIPNSNSFKIDLDCARKIKKAPASSKRYAHLC